MGWWGGRGAAYDPHLFCHIKLEKVVPDLNAVKDIPV